MTTKKSGLGKGLGALLSAYDDYDNTVSTTLKGNIFKGPFHIPRLYIIMAVMILKEQVASQPTTIIVSKIIEVINLKNLKQSN